MNKQFIFFKLLKEYSGSNFRKIVFYSLVSGIANTVLLVIINTASHAAIHGQVDFILLGEFIVLMCLFYFTKRYILVTTIVLVEKIVASIRSRIINRVRETNLYLLDKLGNSKIYARLTQDTATLSQAAPVVIRGMQAGIMIAFVMVYLALISIPAFVSVVVAVGAAVALYIHYEKKVRSNMVLATKIEARFFSLLDGMLKGMKEIKLNRKKNDAVYADICENIEYGREIKVGNSTQFAQSSMFSETTFYLILGIIVFLLPMYSKAQADEITRIATAVLFIVSPLNRVVGALPYFSRTNVAIRNIEKLENELEDVNPPAENTDFKKFEGFKTIEMRDIYFEYKDPGGDITFVSGPHNYTLERGAKIFLTGGNGAGKSTFLKLLTTQYEPKHGTILVDGIPVRGNDVFPYRELFFTIFTDFYLFEKLYGVDAEPEEVNTTLRFLGLTPDKVTFAEGKFTNLNLSTGQRKRLALLTCLMEDKQIFIMDEVAADQDPEFKKLFYTVLLPKWNEEDGKTILLATHDDGYFQYGTRVVMENGRIKHAEKGL